MDLRDILVIVPCYNEEKALPNTLDELLEHFRPDQILVINDGSTDSTPDIAREKGVKLINLCINSGIGVAMQTGYKYADRKGFKHAVQCDGDGQHRPEEIAHLKREMQRTGADMTLGSRFLDKEKDGFKSLFLRRAAIRWLSFLIKLLSGKKIYDVTSGFRLANRKTIELFSRYYPFDYPEPESLVLLGNHNLNAVETPVSMRARKGGVSSIGALNGAYYMVKVTIGLAITRLRGKH